MLYPCILLSSLKGRVILCKSPSNERSLSAIPAGHLPGEQSTLRMSYHFLGPPSSPFKAHSAPCKQCVTCTMCQEMIMIYK